MTRITLGLTALLLPLLAMAGPVDINSADAATLARELNGVGDSRARAIVEYREKNGRFASPEDLMRVSGIGQQVFNLNRDNIRVGGEARPAAKPAP
jgi:competence protein ComEA